MRFVLLCLCILLSHTAIAAFTINGIVYNKTSDSTVTAFAIDTCKIINIPAVVQDNGINYSVTIFGGIENTKYGVDWEEVILPNSIIEIADNGFHSVYNLTSVILPDSLEKIGESVFINCSSLTNINLPNSIKHIGNDAFRSSGLVSIKLPDNLEYMGTKGFYGCKNLESAIMSPSLNYIPQYSFEYCRKLKKVTIPETCETIGKFAFSYCESLETIDLPNSITRISSGAFWRCTNLTSFVVPPKVMNISNNLFGGCYRLTSVILHDSIVSIGQGAFRYVKASSIEMPKSVVSIGPDAFYSSNIATITLPDSLKTIESSLFYDCDSLKYVVIPDSVTSIGSKAFYLSGVETVVIPDSVKTIGENAFSKCYNLTRIYTKADVPPQLDMYVFSKTDNCTLFVENVTAISAYQAADQWKDLVIVLAGDIPTAVTDDNRKSYASDGFSLQIAPTPTEMIGKIICSSSEVGTALFTLFSKTGTVITTIETELLEDEIQIIDMSIVPSLPKGIYYIEMKINGEQKAISRMIKL